MEILDYKRLLRDANYTEQHITAMFNKGSEVFIIQNGWIVLGGFIGTCVHNYGNQNLYYVNSLCMRTDPHGVGLATQHNIDRDTVQIMHELTTATRQLLQALIEFTYNHPLRPRIVIPGHHFTRFSHVMNDSTLFELSWHGPLPNDMIEHISNQLPARNDMKTMIHNIYSRTDQNLELHLSDVPACCKKDISGTHKGTLQWGLNTFSHIGHGVFDYGIAPFLLSIYKCDFNNGVSDGAVYAVNITDSQIELEHDSIYQTLKRRQRYFREKKHDNARSFGLSKYHTPTRRLNENHNGKTERKPNYLPRFNPYH